MDRPLTNDSTDPAHAAPGRNAAFNIQTARSSEARRDDRPGWRPHIPSVGPQNRVSAPLAPTIPLARRRESPFRVAWHPQDPSYGVANRNFVRCGTHKSPRMASRIAVSPRLAPTRPLVWRRESEFRAVWYPQSPRMASRIAVSRRLAPTVHPSSFILHPSSFILHPSSFILHPSSFILHPSSFILHPSPFPDSRAVPRALHGAGAVW